MDGRFEVKVPAGSATQEVSYVGFTSKSVNVAENVNNSTFLLALSTTEVKDVVVTSFGIKKQKIALGYAVGEVKGDDLTKTKEVKLANVLQGRIAGVNVSAPATGSIGSSRVIIRGATSATGSNQPLYVVDGIPIDNTQQGNVGLYCGADKGDGMSSFNPDDIATMSVLIGSAASALYGNRGCNGVILITTKKAKSGTGIGVNFNTRVTARRDVNNLKCQDQYGIGAPDDAGIPTREITLENIRDAFYFTWGDKYDGSSIVGVDGQPHTYSA